MVNNGISIVISTWCRSEQLNELVVKLLLQDPITLPYEIIVVDSYSKDGSEIKLKQHLQETIEDSVIISKVKYLNTSNSLSSKRNFGAKNSIYSHLVFLDDDVLIKGCNYLHNIQQILKSNLLDKTIVSGYVRFPPWYLKSNYFKFKDSRHEWPEAVEDLSSVPFGKFIAMNFLIKKDSFFLIGLFNEEFKLYGGEDRDFEIRSRSMGYKHIISKLMFSYHCEGNGSINGFYNKMRRNSEFGFEMIKSLYGLNMFSSKVQNMESKAEFLTANLYLSYLMRFFIKLLSKVIFVILTVFNRTPLNLNSIFSFYFLLAHLEGVLNRGRVKMDKFL